MECQKGRDENALSQNQKALILGGFRSMICPRNLEDSVQQMPLTNPTLASSRNVLNVLSILHWVFSVGSRGLGESFFDAFHMCVGANKSALAKRLLIIEAVYLRTRALSVVIRLAYSALVFVPCLFAIISDSLRIVSCADAPAAPYTCQPIGTRKTSH